MDWKDKKLFKLSLDEITRDPDALYDLMDVRYGDTENLFLNVHGLTAKVAYDLFSSCGADRDETTALLHSDAYDIAAETGKNPRHIILSMMDLYCANHALFDNAPARTALAVLVTYDLNMQGNIQRSAYFGNFLLGALETPVKGWSFNRYDLLQVRKEVRRELTSPAPL